MVNCYSCVPRSWMLDPDVLEIRKERRSFINSNQFTLVETPDEAMAFPLNSTSSQKLDDSNHPGARDLLEKLLKINPIHRITLEEAKKHPYIVRLRAQLAAVAGSSNADADIETPQIIEDQMPQMQQPQDSVDNLLMASDDECEDFEQFVVASNRSSSSSSSSSSLKRSRTSHNSHSTQPRSTVAVAAAGNNSPSRSYEISQMLPPPRKRPART